MNMTRWLLSLSMALGACACSGRKADPPPPASSAVVPPAAPNARGTMAAGRAPVPGLAGPSDPDQEDSEETPPPGRPTPPALTPDPEDSGVTL